MHEHLVRKGLRTSTGLVVETGSARDVHHFALLAGYGAEAIHPYLALETLATLPDREFTSGLAEVVKYGVIWDAELFRNLERHAQQLAERDADLLETIIARCCEIKADVVGRDEREGGLRAILILWVLFAGAAAGAGWRTGKATRTVVPRPGSLSTSIRPRWASTIL